MQISFNLDLVITLNFEALKSISRIFEPRSHFGIPDKTVLEPPLATHLRNLNPLLSNSEVDLREIILRSSSESEANKRSSMYRLFSIAVKVIVSAFVGFSVINFSIAKSAIKGLELIPQTCLVNL